MSMVTVIVPVYNISPYLDKCITSIINQTYSNLQIVIVNDGSTDDSENVIKRYATCESRITYLSKPNGGLVSARKAGLELAEGKYIAYIDGDDWVDDDYVESLVRVAEAEEADIVTSGYNREGQITTDAIATGVYTGDSIRIMRENMLSTGVFYNFGILPFLWGKLFRKDILMKNQYEVDNQIKVGEDVACTYPTLLDTKKVVVTNICKYYYRVRNDSMTAARNDRPDETIEHLFSRCKDLRIRIGERGDKCHNINEQLNKYFLLNLLNKYPELLFDKEAKTYLPYGIEKNDRIVLYGAGRLGLRLYNIFVKHGFCQVVGITDKNAYGKNDLLQSTDILKLEFDKVVIAVLQLDVASQIKQWLMAVGVPEEKIKLLDSTVDCGSIFGEG